MIGKAAPIEHGVFLLRNAQTSFTQLTRKATELSFERESEAYYDSCVISNLPSITIDNGKLSDEL